MKLRQLMIRDWLAQHRFVVLTAVLLVPFLGFWSAIGIPVSRLPVEGKLVRYGLSLSKWANGEFAYVALEDGRTVKAHHDVAKPYIAPGAEVKMQEMTDLWGFRWYMVDHQATSQNTDTP